MLTAEQIKRVSIRLAAISVLGHSFRDTVSALLKIEGLPGVFCNLVQYNAMSIARVAHDQGFKISTEFGTWVFNPTAPKAAQFITA